MRREDRANAVDYRAAVGLEGVGGVVEAVAKHQSDEEIRGAVEAVFDPRIIDHAAALEKTAAEDAVDAVIELLPVAHNIPAIVGFIGHHDDDRIATHCIEAASDGAAKAMRARALDRAQHGDFFAQALENAPGVVGRAVIDDHNFVWHIAQAKLEVEVLNRGGDATFFIPRRDDDAEKLERIGHELEIYERM